MAQEEKPSTDAVEQVIEDKTGKGPQEVEQDPVQKARKTAQDTADGYARELAKERAKEQAEEQFTMPPAPAMPQVKVGDKYFSVNELRTGSDWGWREGLVELVKGQGEKTVCYLPIPTTIVDKVEDLQPLQSATSDEKRVQNKVMVKAMFGVAADAILHPKTHEKLFNNVEEMVEVVPPDMMLKYFQLAAGSLMEAGEKKGSDPETTSSTDSADISG